MEAPKHTDPVVAELLRALEVAAQLAEQILHGNATAYGGAKLIADNSRAAIARATGGEG